MIFILKSFKADLVTKEDPTKLYTDLKLIGQG